MSSTRRPPASRPLPAAVYWRRRAMVAGTVVLLVIAGIDLVNGGDDEPSPTATAQQVAGTPQATPSAAVPIGPRKGRRHQKPTAAPTFTPPPAPEPAEPDGRCADPDVVVTPVMAPAVAGRSVLITLELRTREAEACTWTISRRHLAYKITDDDGDDVWSSSQCPGQVPDDPIVVRRDLTATYRMAWNGRASSLDCPVSMDYVAPGDYAVQAAAIGGEPSEVVPFTLTDPAEVAPQEPAGPPVPESADGDEDGKKKGDKKDGKKHGGKSKAKESSGDGSPDEASPSR